MSFKFRHVTVKLGNMRKEAEFVVCPVSNTAPHEITIQSDKRIARVNLETKKVIVSDGKGGHPGFHKLQAFCGAKEYDAPQDLLDQLSALEEDHGPMESGPVVVMDENGPAPSVHARRETVPSGPVSIFDL